MADDFTPPRPLGRSWRWLVKSVNYVKPDQLGNVNLTLGDLSDGRASKIDVFDVADAATTVFTLTYEPVPDSWNVNMGWPWVDGEDYTISGQTLTVLDAAFFRGIVANGPRVLHAQYDYETPPPPATPPTIASNTATGSDPIVFDSVPAAGSDVLLATATSFHGTSAPSGLGASWNLLVALDTNSTRGVLEIWYGGGCNGVDDTINVFGTNSNGTAVEVIGTTRTGAVTDSELHTTPSVGPLVAPAGGGLAFYYSADMGTFLSETPSPWTVLPDQGVATENFGIVAVADGETARRDYTTSGLWVAVIVPAT